MECTRLCPARCMLFIAAWLFAVYPPPLFSQAAAAAPATTPIEITSTPSTGAPGKSDLGLTIQPSDPKNCTSFVATPLKLVVPSENSIDLLKQSFQDPCTVFADIEIEKDATPNTTVMLRLQDAKGEVWGKPFPFNIATPPRPRPDPARDEAGPRCDVGRGAG